MKEKNSFLIYYDFETQTAALSDAQVGQLLRAMLAYEKRGEVPEGLEGPIQMAFQFLKPVLDSNREKYARICARNRRNGLMAHARNDYILDDFAQSDPVGPIGGR